MTDITCNGCELQIELRARIAILETALEFYADSDGYQDGALQIYVCTDAEEGSGDADHDCEASQWECCVPEDDNGRTARDALRAGRP